MNQEGGEALSQTIIIIIWMKVTLGAYQEILILSQDTSILNHLVM